MKPEDLRKIYNHNVDNAGTNEHEIEFPPDLVHRNRCSHEGDFAGQVERSNTQCYSLRAKVIGEDFGNVHVLRAK